MRRMVLFDRDGASGRSAEDVELVRRAREKLPVKATLTGMIKNHWFFKDSARARGQIFKTFWMRKSYIFICFIDMRC